MPGPVSATDTSTMPSPDGLLDTKQFSPLALDDRFDGISKQIEQHLLDLHLVGQDQVVRRIDLKAHPDAVLLRPNEGEGARFLDQLVDAFDAPLALATRDEIAQPADDLAGAQRLLGRLVHGAADQL